MREYPYLQDSAFLREMDELSVKEQWVKITLLEFATEKPITDIEGRVKNGSFNFNAKSSLRRTAQFSMVAENDGDITNAANLISINKKVSIKVGITNTTFKYQEYPIIWYPLGLYVITEAQVNRGKENITISVNLKDKMCLMNGDCGGTIPAAATLSEYDTIDENGMEITKKITIVQLIREIVNHYGGEQLGKIIISDLDNRVKQVMMWNSEKPLYFYQNAPDDNIYTLDPPGQGETPTKVFKNGDDIGFVYTDFTYPGQLTSVAGDTVCTVLDKITSVLGNFEYFYDIEGNFIFQEIKNNLNNSQSQKIILQTQSAAAASPIPYNVDFSRGVSEYDFSDSILIKTFSNNPHYNNVKNDFMVWGTRKTATSQAFPIRFHLAIDQKPDIGYQDAVYNVNLYEDENGNTRAVKPILFDYPSSPAVGAEGLIYEDNTTHKLYKWGLDIDPSSANYEKYGYIPVLIEVNALPDEGVIGWNYLLNGTTAYKCLYGKSENMTTAECYQQLDKVPYRAVDIHTNTADWRTILYLQGVIADATGTDSNYYYSELYNEWPKMFDIETNQWKTKSNSDLDFYLDFIDTNAKLGELSVNNIGRRSMVVDDKNINCIFESDIVDCIIINTASPTMVEEVAECEANNQPYSQVRTEVYDSMVTGGTANSAYNLIKDLLYQYTSYNETVAITTVPMYHMQVGIRVTIQDTKTGIYGDYMVNSISCNLETSGSMSLSCTRILEKI